MYMSLHEAEVFRRFIERETKPLLDRIEALETALRKDDPSYDPRQAQGVLSPDEPVEPTPTKRKARK
jgi:hypothetical protein